MAAGAVVALRADVQEKARAADGTVEFECDREAVADAALGRIVMW